MLLTSPHSWLRHLVQVVIKIICYARQERLHFSAANSTKQRDSRLLS